MTVLLFSLVLLMLLAMSGFFSSAEAVFFSLNPLHLRRLSQKRPAAGARIHALMASPTRLLSTILIGNTIVNVAASDVGYVMAERLFPGHGEAISIPALTLLLLFFGEVGPKRLGLLITNTLAYLYAPILVVAIRLATPVSVLLEKTTQVFASVFRPRGATLSEEEFKTVLDISREEGILNADELAMIKAIVDLEDLHACDVMTPRVDVVGVDLNDDHARALQTARKCKHHFLPLYRERLDEVEGFLDVRRFLLDPEHRIEAARRPPFYVTESAPLNQLLQRFQKEKRRIAIVVDEYGGTAGLLTRGDILEELTGDIYNELNKPRPLFQSAGPHRWLVDANISLEEINRKLLLHMESENFDRLAGWITERLGHVPEQSDTIEAQGVRVTVLQTIKLRVTLAQIEMLEQKGGGS